MTYSALDITLILATFLPVFGAIAYLGYRLVASSRRAEEMKLTRRKVKNKKLQNIEEAVDKVIEKTSVEEAGKKQNIAGEGEIVTKVVGHVSNTQWELPELSKKVERDSIQKRLDSLTEAMQKLSDESHQQIVIQKELGKLIDESHQQIVGNELSKLIRAWDNDYALPAVVNPHLYKIFVDSNVHLDFNDFALLYNQGNVVDESQRETISRIKAKLLTAFYFSSLAESKK